MKRNLVNFTRGSQLLGHFSFMFAAGLKGPLIIASIVISWMTWWTLSADLTDHEAYLVWMRIYAAIYGFMEFDPAKQVALKTAYGATVQFPIRLIETFPPVMRAWEHMVSLAEGALLRAGLLLVPSFALFYWFAARFGGRSKERKHERGAMLVTLPELVGELRDHNRRERERELTEAMGWKWRLSGSRELARAFPYSPAQLAAVTYPWRLEQSHAMLIGTTGMGKTVAMSDMIAEARFRHQRCVIFDLTGAFIEHFYDSGRDLILNPLDARCPRWSLFDECRTEGEFWAAAEALVPHDGGGEAQFWVVAARALFVEMCLKLVADGTATNEALAQKLMTADLTQVHAMMRGTIADPLTAPEAARMAESIRAVFNVNAKALKLLPSSGPSFSLRSWIEEDDGTGSAIFISARYVDMSVCAQLLTLWLDTAMNTLMTTPRTRELRFWFFIDELGALHRLPALEKGLQTARNFGGAIVTGIHAYAKLKEVYGENMAMTLSSLARTKLILGTADRDTATWCSDFIGHRQVRDMEEAYTYGYNNARDAVSLTPRKHIEPLLLPDQLMNLARLSGYIKFPDGFPAAPVKLVPVSRPKRAETFIGRAKDRSSPPVPIADRTGHDPRSEVKTEQGEHPSSNDDGAGKPVVPKLGALALEPTRDNKRHGNPDKSDRNPKDGDRPGQVERSGAKPEGRRGEGPRAPNQGEHVAPTLPRDSTLRTGKSATDPQERSDEDPQRSDAPKSKGLPDRGVQQPNEDRLPRDDGRKLMLEDGVPENDSPSEPTPDLDDFGI
jgi:type IV conjugative transfer system coupling protein TraD